MGEGACQADIFTKYRLGCELSYGTCPISLCAFVTLIIQGGACILYYYYRYNGKTTLNRSVNG